MREAACGVARAALLGATPAVVRGRGERTTAVEPCWPSPADGCCPGSSQSDGASNCSPRWRAAELLGAASGCCPRSTRSDSAELLGAGPAAGARGCVLGQAPSCWVRRRLLLLSDTEAIGQQVGRDVRLLPAVEPCWPPSPWGVGCCPRSSRSDSASSCSPTLAPPSCWARHRAVARGQPDRTVRRLLTREAACWVECAELLGAASAVVRCRGDRTAGRARRPAVARGRAVLAAVTLGASAVAQGQADRTVRRAVRQRWRRRAVGRGIGLLPEVNPIGQCAGC